MSLDVSNLFIPLAVGLIALVFAFVLYSLLHNIVLVVSDRPVVFAHDQLKQSILDLKSTLNDSALLFVFAVVLYCFGALMVSLSASVFTYESLLTSSKPIAGLVEKSKERGIGDKYARFLALFEFNDSGYRYDSKVDGFIKVESDNGHQFFITHLGSSVLSNKLIERAQAALPQLKEISTIKPEGDFSENIQYLVDELNEALHDSNIQLNHDLSIINVPKSGSLEKLLFVPGNQQSLKEEPVFPYQLLAGFTSSYYYHAKNIAEKNAQYNQSIQACRNMIKFAESINFMLAIFMPLFLGLMFLLGLVYFFKLKYVSGDSGLAHKQFELPTYVLTFIMPLLTFYVYHMHLRSGLVFIFAVEILAIASCSWVLLKFPKMLSEKKEKERIQMLRMLCIAVLAFVLMAYAKAAMQIVILKNNEAMARHVLGFYRSEVVHLATKAEIANP